MTLDVFIDHTCPFSYMAFSAVRRIVLPAGSDAADGTRDWGTGVAHRDSGTLVRWRMLPLAVGGPDATPAEAAMRAVRQAAAWPDVAALAEESYGLRLVEPDWGVDARPAALAAKWSEAHAADRVTAFHSTVFRGYFELGSDIADAAVLDDLARSAGIAALGSLAIWLADDAAALAALAADAALAEANGITAVPAILVDGRHLLLGAQPEAVIRATLGELAPVPA